MFKTADLCDEFEDEVKVCLQVFKSFGKIKTFHGPIETVQVFEDNVLVREALETVSEHSVVVVDGGASNRCALLGDQLGEIAVRRKLAGIIINGFVRDIGQLNNLNIGIMALGSNPLRSIKKGKGDRNVILSFGELTWEPGNFVYVDEDGIILTKRDILK